MAVIKCSIRAGTNSRLDLDWDLEYSFYQVLSSTVPFDEDGMRYY
jgi:hypothetical protein